MTNPMDDRRAVSVTVTGRVQGVWYRGWTVEQARARQLDGWVRNREDGSVEALFAGHGSDVDAMLDACWQGPANAIVINVKVSEAADPGLSGFDQRPTV
ncbi:acylphosphatase [Niveispirillum sp. KHB5.9]|uniref:acylphosphatase n=1 Tax=Niveispirillum sp. KHB5.9 TaxID=3400269 RepID=UPI003A8ADA03